MTAAPERSGTRLALVAALVVVCVGGWLLLDAAGVETPPWSDGWPVFLLIGGVASTVDGLFLSRRPRSFGFAAVGLGFGALAFAFTLGYLGFRPVMAWLPALPLVVGIAFLAVWAAGRMRSTGLLVAGVAGVAVGLTGFATRWQWLERLVPSAQVVWAVLLLAAGVLLLWRVFRPRRR